MKETPFFFWIKVAILVVILTFGFGVIVGGVNDERINTMSIEE